MDFRLSAEQEQIRHSVREIVTGFPGAYWQKLDRELGYPQEFIDALTQGGWLAALIPEEYGGFGLGVVEASLILEEINRSPGNGGVPRANVHHGDAAAARLERAEETVSAADRRR